MYFKRKIVYVTRLFFRAQQTKVGQAEVGMKPFSEHCALHPHTILIERERVGRERERKGGEGERVRESEGEGCEEKRYRGRRRVE